MWWIAIVVISLILIGLIYGKFNEIDSIKDFFLKHLIPIFVLVVILAISFAKYLEYRDNIVIHDYLHNEYVKNDNGIYVHLKIDYD